MKLGFIAQSDLPGIESDCRFAVDHGFRGLEFNYWGNFKDLTADTVAQIYDLLKHYGVECSTFGIWGWNESAAIAGMTEIAIITHVPGVTVCMWRVWP